MRDPTVRVPPEQYPWWVKFSLVGARSRNSQWLWTLATLVAGVFLVFSALTDTGIAALAYGVAGAWAFIAAGLYVATIRWIDRHGSWR